jgi:hypothetical protein
MPPRHGSSTCVRELVHIAQLPERRAADALMQTWLAEGRKHASGEAEQD